MRTLLIAAWLCLPVAALGFHFGPGQDWMARDEAGRKLSTADEHVRGQRWNEAIAAYDQALAKIPAEDKPLVRRVRLERAKAQMFVQQLPEAHAELHALVDEVVADPSAEPTLARDARRALANAQYYVTWLMRLEGEPREVWEPEIDSARQHLRLLAEESERNGDGPAAERCGDDLEAAIRLARMDLGDLQGLSLPCQCQGCKSGKCKNPGKRPKPSHLPKDARAAGLSAPPDGRGS